MAIAVFPIFGDYLLNIAISHTGQQQQFVPTGGNHTAPQAQAIIECWSLRANREVAHAQ